MIIFLSILGLAIVALGYGSIVKNNLGLNLSQVHCPHCQALQPMFRRPTNGRQALWGGWTCEACGTEMDKWGRQVQSAIARAAAPPTA